MTIPYVDLQLLEAVEALLKEVGTHNFSRSHAPAFNTNCDAGASRMGSHSSEWEPEKINFDYLQVVIDN